MYLSFKGKLVASDATENLVSLMSGAQEIEVTVRTDVANAQKELAAISEISKVEVKMKMQESWLSMQRKAQMYGKMCSVSLQKSILRCLKCTR